LDKTLEAIPANITKLLNIDKTNFISPSPQFKVVNNAETFFWYIPWHKLNIELGQRGFKKGNVIQHGVYHKNMRIFYRGKIVSTCFVQDCRPSLKTSKFCLYFSGSCIPLNPHPCLLDLSTPINRSRYYNIKRSLIYCYIITLRIDAISLVESHDLLEHRRTELRH
jgi:hypothetical protein